jgi:hypothetical protein
MTVTDRDRVANLVGIRLPTTTTSSLISSCGCGWADPGKKKSGSIEKKNKAFFMVLNRPIVKHRRLGVKISADFRREQRRAVCERYLK